MKTAYILFSKRKPENNKTILDSITYFCREHCLTYRARPDLDCSTITIDGNDYNINLLEISGESEPTYWMIYCSLNRKTICSAHTTSVYPFTSSRSISASP